MPPQAAQFIFDKIAEQAARENIALSEVERNMLLFSETSPTLPNISEVNEAFERDYDRLQYEEKIANLIRHIRSALLKGSDANKAWKQAISSLQGEDYYILVMLNDTRHNERPRGDLVRLIGTALPIVAILLGIALFLVR
jgi:hypothetical protein